MSPLPPTEPCPSVLSLSLAVHPDMVTIATGQVAGTTKEGKVTDWRGQDLETRAGWGWGQTAGPPPGNRPLSSLQPLPPHVRIWDSVSLSTLHVLGLGVFDRAVCCVGFSKSVSPAPPFDCPPPPESGVSAYLCDLTGMLLAHVRGTHMS